MQTGCLHWTVVNKTKRVVGAFSWEKTRKMSKAAISSSAASVRRVLYANVTTLTVIACVLCVGPYISASLSVTGSVKLVVEVLCCYLLVVNLILTVSLRDAELPPYRSQQRTTSLKVKHAEILSTVVIGTSTNNTLFTDIIRGYSCSLVAAVRKGMRVVKLCSNKIFRFIYWGCRLTHLSRIDALQIGTSHSSK